MVEVFFFIADNKAGKPGIVSLEQGKGTCQLADTASGTFVKVCMNQGFDGCSPDYNLYYI